jgi:hypothetical protein
MIRDRSPAPSQAHGRIPRFVGDDEIGPADGCKLTVEAFLVLGFPQGP